MREYMAALIECSITMSVLVLGFITATPWLSKRYSAKWLYYIWLVLVIGLIIPFRVHPDTAFIQVNGSPAYIQQIMPGNAENIVDPTIAANLPSQELSAISWYQIGICLWAAGLLAFMIFHGLKHFRFLRMVKRWSERPDKQMSAILQKIKADMGITAPVKLKICSCISSPMMIGFVKPAILLPCSDFSAEELPHILKHELVHFKRKDLWYKSLILYATAVHWFNPVMYVMAKTIASQCEISCDAEVVSKTDIGTRQQYIETIIGVIKNQSRMQTAFSTNFYGGKKGMKKRILSIMDTGKKRAGVLILCLVVSGTLGTGAAFAENNEAVSGAYSTNTPISAQDQEKLNRQTKEATAKTYAVYEKYGLTYEEKTDSFYYGGKLVRYFSDKLDADGTYNSFTRTNGVVDLKAIRNTDYALTGISPVSQEEYDKHTKSMESAKNIQGTAQENGSVNKTGGVNSAIENSGTGYIVSGSAAAFSEGDPNYVDTSLNAYLNYGVSYDKTNKQWIFDNKPIHYLNDEGHTTFIDNSDNAAKNGVSLEVIRKSGGKIENLVEISD